MISMRLVSLLLLLLQYPIQCESLSISTTTAPGTILSVQDSLNRGQQIHDEECQYGFEKFGRVETPTIKSWADDDFVTYSVGKENSGPDDLPKNGDVIFQSKQPLITQEECQALVDEARQMISDGLSGERGEDNRPTNSELGEARVSTLPKGREWLKEKMHSTLFPLLRDRYGVSDDLTLHDALIIGYGCFGAGSRSQPIHRDSSILSLNVALSPCSDYVGGGTYFEAIPDGYLHQEQGHVTCHAGGTMHAGNGITSGERWILVLFVLDETRPQLARRCHAEGLEAQRSGDLESSKLHFEAALVDAPQNHLVHKDMGRTFMQEGNSVMARRCLSKAAEIYPLDVESSLSLANMLVQANRPRAALRRLDKVFLTQLPDTSLVDSKAWTPLRAKGWEARTLAAGCAIQCAQRAPTSCSKLLLPAMQRLEACIEASPSPPQHLVDMMRAAYRLHKASEE